MYRLIYKSRVARELDWAVVEDILHHGEAKNSLAAIIDCQYGEQDGGVRFSLEAWLALSMIHDIRAIQELPEWKR